MCSCTGGKIIYKTIAVFNFRLVFIPLTRQKQFNSKTHTTQYYGCHLLLMISSYDIMTKIRTQPTKAYSDNLLKTAVNSPDD